MNFFGCPNIGKFKNNVRIVKVKQLLIKTMAGNYCDFMITLNYTGNLITQIFLLVDLVFN